MITEEKALELLKEQIKIEGSQRNFAKKHDLSAKYLGHIVNGRKQISSKILGILGLKRVRVVTITKKIVKL